MLGLLMSILAGAAMSVQGVMNTRLGEHIGIYASNAYVQGTAFLFSMIALWIMGPGNWRNWQSVNKVYWLGGLLGLIITLSVMTGIKQLSPTVAISVILIAQLLVAASIDALGILGTEKTPFHIGQYVGLALLIAGVIVFKRDFGT